MRAFRAAELAFAGEWSKGSQVTCSALAQTTGVLALIACMPARGRLCGMCTCVHVVGARVLRPRVNACARASTSASATT